MSEIVKKVIFLIVLFVCAISTSIGQNSRIYTAEHGLSSSRIRFLYQCKDGFIWVGGENGLDKITGDHIQNFYKNERNSFSISNNDISEIFMDSDNQLWVGTGKGLNRYDSNKNKFEHVILSELEKEERGFSISGIVESVNKEELLVSTSGHGVFFLNKKTKKVDFRRSFALIGKLGTQFIGDLLIDSDNLLWAVTSDSGFVVIDQKKNARKRIPLQPGIPHIKSLISCFRLDQKTGNVIIASSSNGIYIYDRQKGYIRRPSDENLNGMNVQSLLIKRDGTVLLGSENHGIWVFDRVTEKIHPYSVANNNIVDLEHSKVHALLEDKVGNVWAGLYQKGLFIIPKSTSGFEYYAISDDNSGKNRSCVSAFTKDLNGNIWISTDGGGVFKANGMDLTSLRAVNNGLSCQSMISMETDNLGSVWAGSYGHGLFVGNGNEFSQPAYLNEVSNNKIMCLKYDTDRRYLYIGTNGGKFDIVDLKTNTLRHVNAPINKWVRAIHIDKTGRLWIGTSAGTFYYDIDRNKIINVDIGFANQFPTNCFEEYENTIFIGTSAGLVIYDMIKNKHTVFDQLKDSESNNIMSVVMGDDKSLWLTTSKTLSRLNLKTNRIRSFNSFEGFHIGEFRFGSVYKDKNGILLFGGDNGVIKVDPIAASNQQFKMQPIYFTYLQVNNDDIDYNENLKSANLLDASLKDAKKLKLSFKENSFTIFFSAQEYANPKKVNYSYRLSGYDNTWHNTDAANAKASYSSLKPGRYTFEVKGYFDEESNNITSRELRIVVANPWYTSILARVFYFIFLLVLLNFVYIYYKSKQDQKRKLEMAHYNEKVKEDKLRLFTSIAHEIRTPLTLIISPLKKLMNSNTDEESKEMHNLMYRNSMRILQTINQLLDIRKLDNGQLKLHFNEHDLLSIIKSTMLSFKNVATVRQISFLLETSESEKLNVWIDNIHFDKIIYNILSNAFKFTTASGKILIRITCKPNNNELKENAISEYVEIRIFNTGAPIEEKDLKRIFERFYQGNRASETAGSGIGLHLTHELVLLHHGKIEAHNVANEGVEFIVKIPLGNEHLSEEELTPKRSEQDVNEIVESKYEISSEKDFVDSISTLEDNQEGEQKNKYTIMVVDDDEEFCNYIKKELTDYTIITCNSGNKAWKQLLSAHPDVVVTDYMMPDGDGFELCQKIKSNPETDSIPVIILTSEDSENVEMKSVQLNADRFLTKPFNVLILKGAIGQAIRVREKIRNKMHRTEMGYSYETVVIDSADNKLVKKVIDYIKENIEDSEMSVEVLSKEVGLSRVHLNRKLKEILGISPSSLIKSIRLKQAAFLLVNNKVNISEVAYKVGFSSHSYFSYNFHEFFGMSPKEFIIYYAENQDEESIKKLLE